MNNFLQTIAATPPKVWVLLVYLIYIGIKTTRPQRIGIFQLFTLPLMLICLSMAGVLRQGDDIANAVWQSYLGALLLGGIIGWLCSKSTPPMIDRSKQALTLPGGYGTLGLLMGIFVVNYFWGYMYAIHPSFFTLSIKCYQLASSGLLAGLSLGRAISYIYTFFTTP